MIRHPKNDGSSNTSSDNCETIVYTTLFAVELFSTFSDKCY